MAPLVAPKAGLGPSVVSVPMRFQLSGLAGCMPGRNNKATIRSASDEHAGSYLRELAKVAEVCACPVYEGAEPWHVFQSARHTAHASILELLNLCKAVERPVL